MLKKYWLVTLISLLLSLPLSASGKILFEEDFEGDTIGKAPTNFERIDSPVNRANATIEVVKDPEGKSGKTAKMFNFALYIPKAAGRDDWTDWYWEWDWRWDTASNPGNAYRIEDPSNWFHFSPRSDKTTITIWHYANAGWVQAKQATFPIALNTWYRFQQIMQGDHHIVKIKELKDETPFDKIKPAIELSGDKTYKKGAVGGLGTDAGSTWVDNFVLYEEPKDILAVNYHGKLSVIWGKLKEE
ncbi:hypothetical protein FJZ31_23485 [Candidatus Poribacteria bacterium]|nr:hypothetical protein [Candidatus Poribacteria bacterium]